MPLMHCIPNSNKGHPMNLTDLRLLAVFDAIHASASVTRAADALALGQPAVSVALAKLRQHFDDPLFVRTSTGMVPTPFAQGLAPAVRAALEALDVVNAHRNDFDPATAQRTFRLCMTDISQLVLLPPLWQQLRQVAPGVRIEIEPLGTNTAQRLETGDADLALGHIPQLEAGFYQQLLFRQRFVCLVGSAHPVWANGAGADPSSGTLTLAQFQAADHAVITSSGAAPRVVDREIARLGLQRRVVMEIPSFLGAAFVVEHTNMVITIPQRLADLLQGRGAFRQCPVPFALPDYEVKQHWHERDHHDPGNQWLRRTVHQLLAVSDTGAPATPAPK
jgi:DNA-binding transcriptional LysR family regulator